LTRRANQGHIGIIADIVKPAPENRPRVFPFSQDRPKQFQLVEIVSSHFMQFADGSKMI